MKKRQKETKQRQVPSGGSLVLLGLTALFLCGLFLLRGRTRDAGTVALVTPSGSGEDREKRTDQPEGRQENPPEERQRERRETAETGAADLAGRIAEALGRTAPADEAASGGDGASDETGASGGSGASDETGASGGDGASDGTGASGGKDASNGTGASGGEGTPSPYGEVPEDFLPTATWPGAWHTKPDGEREQDAAPDTEDPPDGAEPDWLSGFGAEPDGGEGKRDSADAETEGETDDKDALEAAYDPLPLGPDFPVNVNAADEETLTTIPGVGPVLARRILDYREFHGPFFWIEDLMEVPGIGKAKFERIRDYVTAGEAGNP